MFTSSRNFFKMAWKMQMNNSCSLYTYLLLGVNFSSCLQKVWSITFPSDYITPRIIILPGFLNIRYDLYAKSSFTALETSCLLTPRFLANLDKEVPDEALIDFWRSSRKRGVRLRSLLMLWALQQTFPSTSQALKIWYTVVLG
uniref:Uncharacterized protein n=1 Tax=Lepeophtheirus salmonis TaxID=72036 RepID=A0A0K2T2W3_LEPSM